MREIGYIIVGFNVGATFADFVLRHGGLPWGRGGEIKMLLGAFAVWTVLVFSKESR